MKAADFDDVYGVLAAPPCTDFTISGSQYWAAKDADGRTAESLKLVTHTLDLIASWKKGGACSFGRWRTR